MQTTKKPVFHLLPNAHLDPVWLWDWREGLSEGLTTVTTMLDLMDENPELTFIRGESVIYQHIQKVAPKTFERVRRMIDAGRWDVVGGTLIQPDSNLSSTETLCRHFEAGLEYFEREVGVRPRISWQADSFGHTAGWPNILRSFGMEGFIFTRPQQREFPLSSPVFWWNCDYADRLLCYRQHYTWYCSERHNMNGVLDATLSGASNQPYQNVGVLIGLGNHGGGPSRRHLADVVAWGKAHPEVEIRFSTLHGFFEALQAEIQGMKEVPAVSGELGFCLRGCYSSVQKFKSLFRRAESDLSGAEITQSVIQSQLKSGPGVSLKEAWEAVLFNSFHDILPGSSIERAMEDQMAWTGLAIHHAQKAQFSALNLLASKVDTQVPKASGPDRPRDVPLLVWNPSPEAFQGHVELEAALDYRPIWEYHHRAGELPFHVRDEKGRLLPFQKIETEHSSMVDVPWRKRAVVAMEIPAFGWRVVRMGVAPQELPSHQPENPCKAGRGALPWIGNGDWRVSVNREGGVAIRRKGKNFLLSNKNLRLLVTDDPWGSWGGMEEETDALRLEKIREEWKLTASEVLESGPERASLWTRWGGANSWIDLTFSVCREAPCVEVQGRMLWNERSARLQLVLPSMGAATCDLPGSVGERTTDGQVPVGRWFCRKNSSGAVLGVASDVLSDADFFKTETRLTLARASRYANDQRTAADEKLWMPAVDCGELKFRLGLFSDGIAGDKVASSFLSPPVALAVTPAPGELPRRGSLGSLKPATLRLLSAQWAGGKLRVRVQNRGSRPCEGRLQLGSTIHSLGKIGPQQIVTKSLTGEKPAPLAVGASGRGIAPDPKSRAGSNGHAPVVLRPNGSN